MAPAHARRGQEQCFPPRVKPIELERKAVATASLFRFHKGNKEVTSRSTNLWRCCLLTNINTFKKMILRLRFCLILAFFSLFFACEEDFVPEQVAVVPQIVVEGYIEAADDRFVPPYVILTRNLPFFTSLDSNQFADFYVHDALVTVDDGTQSVVLTEICLNNLSPEQIALATNFLGTNVELIPINFCVYLDPSFSMQGEAGKTYTLRVEAEGKSLRSVASIPPLVGLDSLWFVPPPGLATRDSLAQLQARLSDPPGKNFYRYFINVNNTGLRRDDFSVLEDPFFDGRSFDFPLNRPRDPGEEFDLSTFGLFQLGDTVTLKWLNIGEEVFRFWNTIEFAAANQGPFSNATIIDSNIEGGLGVWSAQSAVYYDLIVDIR